MPTSDPQQFADEAFCYLTTTGRVTGRPHTIEIWFALEGHTLYMLSGGGAGADWVKNLMRRPDVTVRIRDVVYPGRSRIVEGGDEDALARRIVVDKYQPGYGEDLSGWGRESLVVAMDLEDGG
jgi:deazaflavin-dependent oxidoreductase (nitroreductase family)